MTRSTALLTGFLVAVVGLSGPEVTASIIYDGRAASTEALLSNDLVGTRNEISSGTDFSEFAATSSVSAGEPFASIHQVSTLASDAIVSTAGYLVSPTFDGEGLDEVLRVASVLTVDFTMARTSRWTIDLMLTDGPYDFGGGTAGSGLLRMRLIGPAGGLSAFDQTVGFLSSSGEIELTRFRDRGLLVPEDYRLELSIDYEISAFIGGGGTSSYALRLQTAPIPEPGGFLVFGAALMILRRSRGRFARPRT